MLRLVNRHPPRINEMHHVCMQMQTRCIMLVPSLSTRQVAALLGRATMTGDDMTVLFSPAQESLPALPRDAAPLADATLYALLTALAPEIGYEIV